MFKNTVLKELRNSKDLTQEQLADKLGLSKSAISMYENGNRVPSLEILETFADYFNVDINKLTGSNDVKALFATNIFPVSFRKIPLLGEIACGQPIYAQEERGQNIMADCDINADFCLKAKGDSMINARIMDGDIVFIHSQPIVENGEIAAVVIDNEATLKRVYYYPERNKLVLNAENPNYEPFVYVGDELEEIYILGKAVFFTSSIY